MAQVASIRIGLRFDRSQAAPLRAIAARVRASEFAGQLDVSTFDGAADAAETGEPLIVVCDNVTEALLLADGYVAWGIRRPAVEALSN